MNKHWIEIIDNERLVQRVAEEPENADLFGDLPGSTAPRRLHFVERPTYGRGKRHIVLSLDRRIVGIAEVQVDSTDSRKLLYMYVSVEEGCWGRAYGGALAEEVYHYAVQQGQVVDHSDFTTLGKQRLEHIRAELKRKFPQAVQAD